MSRKFQNFCIEKKLKPNQKLECSGCNNIFESVIAAAQHTVHCTKTSVGIMEKRKRKKEEPNPQMKIKFLKSASNPTPNQNTGRVCTVTLHWSRQNSAIFLKSLYKRAHLFSKNDPGETRIWQDIVTEVKPQVPWIFGPICQTRWKKLRQETEKYMTEQGNEDDSSKDAKPDFYFIIREIIRKMSTSLNEDVICKTEDGENDTNDEELADPDALEDEPFAGVMDSQGNMHLRDLLIEIVHSIEVNPSLSDEQLVEKHGVEEAIVEWVKENQEAVIKGSLQCSVCTKRILKRKDYILHELDCIIESEKNKTEKEKGGFIISYANKDDGCWTPATVSTLIKVFRARAPAFVSHEGTLRKGIWLEVFKELKPKVPTITPQMCSNKWTQLVAGARNYWNLRKNNVDGKESEKTPLVPEYFDKIAAIVDLENPHSLAPKDVFPERQDSAAPRVFVKTRSEGEEDEEEEENEVDDANEEAGEEETVDYLNASEDAAAEDSFEDTVSNMDSSEEERKREGKMRMRDKGWNRQRSKDGWRGRVKLGEMERKIEAMSVRFKQLEEENCALRNQSNNEGTREHMTTLINRLDRFLHNQNRFQTQQTETLDKMCSMWERHHRENISAMKTLVQELGKRKEKKTK